MASEAALERRFCRMAKERGAWAVKLQSVTGIPDRILLLPGGEVAFVELKTPTGELSAAQKRTIRRLRKMGFSCFVPRTAGDLEKMFTCLGM